MSKMSKKLIKRFTLLPVTVRRVFYQIISVRFKRILFLQHPKLDQSSALFSVSSGQLLILAIVADRISRINICLPVASTDEFNLCD